MYGHKKSRYSTAACAPVRFCSRCKDEKSFWNVQGGGAEMCCRTCFFAEKGKAHGWVSLGGCYWFIVRISFDVNGFIVLNEL